MSYTRNVGIIATTMVLGSSAAGLAVSYFMLWGQLALFGLTAGALFGVFSLLWMVPLLASTRVSLTLPIVLATTAAVGLVLGYFFHPGFGFLSGCITSVGASIACSAMAPEHPTPLWVCRVCGYDLRGIDTWICPECGHDRRGGRGGPRRGVNQREDLVSDSSSSSRPASSSTRSA